MGWYSDAFLTRRGTRASAFMHANNAFVKLIPILFPIISGSTACHIPIFVLA